MSPSFADKLAREELCIKFVNTVAWRLRESVEDRASTPQVMLQWLSNAGLADRRMLSRVTAQWKARPEEAIAFQKKAASLREAIYKIFLARISDEAVGPAATATLNKYLSGMDSVGLASSGTSLEWQVLKGAQTAEALLPPVAWSAATLLMGPNGQKIRQCQDDRGCGWLFIDESRQQNRRWCSMGDCGNVAKARRHYQRKAVK